MIEFVKVEVLTPRATIEQLRNELHAIGLLTVGNYDHVLSFSKVEGCWRPLEEATPMSGQKHVINYGEEYKLEFRCTMEQTELVKQIILQHHPYEEPVIYFIPLLSI